ncbi:MAG: glycosyltransferase [Candidatus Kapaibacterium sp.]
MLILWIIILFPLFIFFVTSLINIFAGPFLKRAPHESGPRVSVLVPARNEAANIAGCIRSLAAQDYPDMEIIICDDCSTDNTAGIASQAARGADNIRIIEGTEPQPGWTGKNHACHQLSQLATGEILIFTDADDRHATDAVSRTVGYMRKWDASLASAFPGMVMRSPAEKLVIPMIDMIIYSMFILWSARFVPWNIFAAANGQWLAITREAYDTIGGHSGVRDFVVEDVALARRAKKAGLRILTASGLDMVESRMYTGWRDVWQGLSKNLFGLTNYNGPLFAMLLSALFISCVIPFILIFFYPMNIYILIAIAANLLWRLGLAIRYGHNIFFAVLLHPVSITLLIAIGINSWFLSRFRTVAWKDRNIHIRPGRI